MRLFFADGCPYAQRTRALLTLLEKPFEPVVINEYLAEKFAWPRAFSAREGTRARAAPEEAFR